MKIADINFSGNVVKSTVARHLLLPRMPGANLIAIDSLNADEGQGQALRGRQFGELQEYLQTVSAVVALQPRQIGGCPLAAQIIEHRHAMPLAQKKVGAIAADEACPAGNEYG